MNTHIHTDTWMYGAMIVLGLIVLLSILGAITMVAIANQPTPEILIVLGIVAAVILVRLLIPALIIG